MIKRLINTLINKGKSTNNMINDASNDDLESGISISKLVNIFIKDEYTNNQSDKKGSRSKQTQSEFSEESSKMEENENYYDNLSDREIHIIKLEQLNREVGIGKCPTCDESRINETKTNIENKVIRVHSCDNPSCHRYIYPGDRSTVGKLRYDIISEEQNIQETINIK